LVFCVQYRESIFAFVSRLMEHVGISYWFEHEPDRHLLVLGDNSTLAKFTTPQQLRLSARGDIGEIQEFEPSYEFRAGNWALSDYDFEVPTKNLKTLERTVLDIDPMKRFEIFDYPGSYLMRDKGSELTRLRIEQEEVRHCRIDGAGSWAGLDAGKRFVLMPDRADPSARQETYFLTQVRHCAREPGYFSTTEASAATYGNGFSAIPGKTPFRPERLTPQPVVEGPQTATVVGPAGENIHTDQYGRVRVLFHWDRRGKRDEHASCWIRVSQQAAGSHWGGLAIPHVGQEVIVGFLEGDPDRPIIIGHVHNGTNMPPLNLPRDRHKTVIRDHGDNRLIMHGQAGQQWLSAVSPRAVNLVAMRTLAKPLSADISIGNVDLPPYEDNDGYSEIYSLWQELQTGMTPPEPGKSVLDRTGAEAGYTADLNLLGEGKINTLSGGNTNTWVGGNLNTWVDMNVSTQVNGNATAVIGGTAYGGTSTTSWNSTEVWGDNITYAHHDNITTADNNNVTIVPHGENNQYVTGVNRSIVSGHNISVVYPDNLQLVGGLNTAITLGINTQIALPLSLAYTATSMQLTNFSISKTMFDIELDAAVHIRNAGMLIKDVGLFLLI
jgi:type VI secretion system secreted protein VgrG